MFVTAHARARLADRLGARAGARMADQLEGMNAPPGRIAYALGAQGVSAVTLAIAEDGTVQTVLLRHAWQAMSPRTLKVERVVRVPEAAGRGAS